MTKLDDMWKWFAQKEIGICPDMQSFIVDWGGEGRPLLTQALTSTCWSQVRYLAALGQAEKLTDSGIFSIPILRAWFIQLLDWKKKKEWIWDRSTSLFRPSQWHLCGSRARDLSSQFSGRGEDAGSHGDWLHFSASWAEARSDGDRGTANGQSTLRALSSRCRVVVSSLWTILSLRQSKAEGVGPLLPETVRGLLGCTFSEGVVT